MNSLSTIEKIEKVMLLSSKNQSFCLFLAAKEVFKFWQSRNHQKDLHQTSNLFLKKYLSWYESKISDRELLTHSNTLYDTLPSSLESETHLRSAYVGISMHTVSVVALDRCEDVCFDMILTAVLYSAAAYCDIGKDAIRG
ncbi:MAG: hypothetical protein AAGD96_36440, partial [Chloroflexota bacterium]